MGWQYQLPNQRAQFPGHSDWSREGQVAQAGTIRALSSETDRNKRDRISFFWIVRLPGIISDATMEKAC